MVNWEEYIQKVRGRFPCAPGQFFVYFLPEGQKINHNYDLPSKNIQKIDQNRAENLSLVDEILDFNEESNAIKIYEGS